MVNKDNILFPATFSHSSLGVFKTCLKKGYYSRILHLQRSTAPSEHLLAGSLFASAMEQIRNDVYIEGLEQDHALQRGKELILEGEDTGSFNKSNEQVAAAFERYILRFPLESSFKPFTLEDGGKGIEYYFEIDTGIPHPDFPEKTILYNGYLDGFYEHWVKGKVDGCYVVDEKTTSKLFRIPRTISKEEPNGRVDMAKEEGTFRLSSQMIGYSVVAKLQGIEANALIRRVPISSKPEEPIEIEIRINQYMRDQWVAGTFGLIEELVERYKRLKAGGKISEIFLGSYGNQCQTYGEICQFSKGCLSKNGELMMLNSSKQGISLMKDKNTRVLVPVARYKKNIKEGNELWQE